MKLGSRHFLYSVKYTDKEEDGGRVETLTSCILMSEPSPREQGDQHLPGRHKSQSSV